MQSLIDCNNGFAPTTSIEVERIFDIWQAETVDGQELPVRIWTIGEKTLSDIDPSEINHPEPDLMPEEWFPGYEGFTVEEKRLSESIGDRPRASVVHSMLQKVSRTGSRYNNLRNLGI